MNKKKYTSVEDLVSHAERQWEKVKELANDGIFDRNFIAYAMGNLNSAHKLAIEENKEYLIR